MSAVSGRGRLVPLLWAEVRQTHRGERVQWVALLTCAPGKERDRERRRGQGSNTHLKARPPVTSFLL